jgi:hypothetical protein
MWHKKASSFFQSQMATKTPTKPKPKQSSQNRSWENLTDRRKLRHIENTLDKAIAQALDDTTIQSHEDFKNYVENFSQKSGKAPITVELCTASDTNEEIKGYRFYLTSDPGHRTSGKYLIKNLEGVTEKDENYFTPSNIAEIFDFAENEFEELDDELDEELDNDSLNLDDTNNELNTELDDLLSENIQIEDSESEENDKKSVKSSGKAQIKTSAKTNSKNQNQLQNKASSKNQSRANATTKNSQSKDSVYEASRLSATAATNGREVNGVNLAGLAGQLGTLGIAVGQGLLEQLAAEADQKRLERILTELQRQNHRVNNLASRLQEVNPDPFESQTTPEKPTLEKSVSEESSSEESVANNPLAVAATKIGSKVDKLGSRLDPKYQSQPLELDKNATVTEQLDQIEAYLKVISKRLDRLEAAVSKLEKQISTQQDNSHIESQVNEEIIEPNSSQAAENSILKQLKARQANQQQSACADALVGFANVTQELFQQSLQEKIAISNNKTLLLKEQGQQVAIALENHQGETIFAGTRNDQWSITTDRLSNEEKTGICKLPQSKEDYALKATAQALISKFQEQIPARFQEDGTTFNWTEKGKVKYEFEVVKLPNNTQLLQGFNPNRNDEQVLDAVLVPGQPAEILQCSIPLQEMESLLNNQQSKRLPQTGVNKDTSKQGNQQAKGKSNDQEIQL